MTWGEYIDLSLKRINTVNSRHLMLHLSKHADREWTPTELKETLKLDIDLQKINQLLKNMEQADLIQRGSSDIDYRGLTDGALNLILRNRFEKEIEYYQKKGKAYYSRYRDWQYTRSMGCSDCRRQRKRRQHHSRSTGFKSHGIPPELLATFKAFEENRDFDSEEVAGLNFLIVHHISNLYQEMLDELAVVHEDIDLIGLKL